jgi:hypothetical protein
MGAGELLFLGFVQGHLEFGGGTGRGSSGVRNVRWPLDCRDYG